MNELFERLSSGTPAFFTKLKYLAGSIAAIMTTVTLSVTFSEKTEEVLWIVIAVLGAVAGTSQLPKKDATQK